jgi:hypothetical protein
MKTEFKFSSQNNNKQSLKQTMQTMSQLQENNITGRESIEIKQGLVNFSK